MPYIDSLSQHYVDINSIIDDQWFTKMSEFQFKCDKMSFSRISRRIKVLLQSLSFSSSEMIINSFLKKWRQKGYKWSYSKVSSHTDVGDGFCW